MKPQDLIPRPARRMRQPRKDVLREELARAATEIERLRIENEQLRRPWWRRLVGNLASATPLNPALAATVGSADDGDSCPKMEKPE